MIYLDYAAATPVSDKALQAMMPYFTVDFFNPSAAYLPAKNVQKDYEEAKDKIAHLIGAKGADLVITAGATEANNLAFTAISRKCLYLATEHESIGAVADKFAATKIKVDRTGLIDLADLKQKLTEDVEMISVALANNELGTIQPLSEIAAIVRAERLRRWQKGNHTPLYFHSDASQAMNLIDINVARMGVDLMTLNSAKIYGPKGVGALYVGHGIKLKPLSYGGGQERGLRSGTENVAGVIGFATAFQETKAHLNGNRKKYQKLVKILKTTLPKETVYLGNMKHQLANFCPILLPGIDAERLIFKLEEAEIYLSTGAACAASKGQKSRTLMAIGLNEDEIAGSLRISLGKFNTEEEVRQAGEKIAEEYYRELARTKQIS